MISLLFFVCTLAWAGDRPVERVPSGPAPTTSPAPARVSSTGMGPREVVDVSVGSTGCLQARKVQKTRGADEYKEWVDISVSFENGCGQDIVAYVGVLEIVSTKGSISARYKLFDSNADAGTATTGKWRFNLYTDTEDTWLFAAPMSSMVYSWQPALVVLADGTTYRSNVAMPERGEQ